MQVLPMTPWALLFLSVLLPLVAILVAAGAGAESRVVGFHVPFIHKSRATWIAGHRAARWAVLPFACCSAVLAVLALDDANAALVPIGWAVWLGGILAGGVVAAIAAHRCEKP